MPFFSSLLAHMDGVKFIKEIKAAGAKIFVQIISNNLPDLSSNRTYIFIQFCQLIISTVYYMNA